MANSDILGLHDLLASRRHEITSLVYQKWVEHEFCSPETALAVHYFDGTYNSLEQYIIEGAPDLPAMHHEENQSDDDYSIISSGSLTYEYFMKHYMGDNRVVLVTGLVDHWKACREWCTTINDESCRGVKCYHNTKINLIPDMKVIKSRYGNSQVEVDPIDNGEKSYNKVRIRIPLSEFSMANKGYVKDYRKFVVLLIPLIFTMMNIKVIIFYLFTYSLFSSTL